MRQKSYDNSPSLYLIPTPVGNMEDITLRCINTLKMVDFILCEDTRITGELLSKLGIKKKLVHSDDHTEDGLKEMVLEKLKEGQNIGLVTDRGTPIISDPGYRIVEFISNLLKNNGCLAMVHRTDRLIEIIGLFEKYGLEVKKLRFIYPKVNTESNMILIEGKKNGNTGLKVLSPLYVHNEDGSYREEVLKMFE